MTIKEQCLNMFEGIGRLDKYNRSFDFQNISVRNFDPPAYMVRIILVDVLGLPDYGPMDKVRWHTVFNFKGKTFLIRDYKFGSWSVESKTNDELTQELVSELKKKIKIASNNLDSVLYKYLKNYVSTGNFYIKNLNNTLASIFYFYLDKTKTTSEEVRNLVCPKPSAEDHNDYTLYNESLNKFYMLKSKLTTNLFSYAYSMIHAFYSYLEFILDVIYAFEQPPDANFWKFREKCWYERFKKVFDLNVKEINEIYVKLLGYRKKYRNPLSHGLTNEISVLIPLPHAGLVPLSYQFLSNELYYGWMGMNDIDVTEEIMKTFESFLYYISKIDPYCYYMRYTEYNFEIPMNKKLVEDIKKEMSCMDDFEEYLKNKAAYMDAVINRDI
jgi:hypothetical protein